jgi:hypothetical protein
MAGKSTASSAKTLIFNIQQRDSTQHRYSSEAGFQPVKKFPAFEET